MTLNKRAPVTNVIPIRRTSAGKSVELFSGCGGLAMGLSLAGFSHELLVERDDDACETLLHNKARKVKHVRHWNVNQDDVRAIDWTAFSSRLDLVAGGPPCQPFSVGGKAAGRGDARDMWPEAIRAVRETLPKAFLFENVQGLLRPRFSSYVSWIAGYLAQPTLVPKEKESHQSHLIRLTRVARDAIYHVQVIPVNAADYGAPQKRNRVLLVGFRKDEFPVVPSFPAPTHSQARLVWDKWISGEYWIRHGLPRPDDAMIPSYESKILEKLQAGLFAPTGQPWITCRDALAGLGEPGTRHDILNHKFQPGAKSYPGHTGSPIDEPAKALKAGVHGVPGGENMLLREGGSVRYFSVREAARLQGLPDDFEFPGSWTESMRQLGNAVPVHLASFAGKWMAAQLASISEGRYSGRSA
jgi:DNA (cytosine-5)-methyltransferase 1